MAVMKLTQDDAKFSEYLKGQMNYAIQRAEVCKKNMGEALKSKNSAGFYKDNLTVSAFQDLSKQLKKDQAEMAQH